MTIICDDSLDPGPEPLAGLRHGVPVQGPHQRLNPLDGPRFCCETLHWPITQRRPTQGSPKGCNQASWEAWPPYPTPPGGSPHGLAGGPWWWAPLGLRPDRSICSRCASCALFCFYKRYQHILQKRKICLTSFHCVWNSAPFDVFMLIISFTVSPARSLETMAALVASCWLIFTGKCLIDFVPTSKKSWDSFVWTN